jgi:hypothetical protein
VANFSLRRYDTQARVSVALSIASCATLVATAFFTLRYLDWSEYTIYYGPVRRLLILGAGAATLALSLAALGLGLNSAGQRRNDQPKLSWLGFFIGAGVFSFAVILLFLFKFRGESVVH